MNAFKHPFLPLHKVAVRKITLSNLLILKVLYTVPKTSCIEEILSVFKGITELLALPHLFFSFACVSDSSLMYTLIIISYVWNIDGRSHGNTICDFNLRININSFFLTFFPLNYIFESLHAPFSQC